MQVVTKRQKWSRKSMNGEVLFPSSKKGLTEVEVLVFEHAYQRTVHLYEFKKYGIME